jgi:glycosyltransferase involved in cell wall biosynthesis
VSVVLATRDQAGWLPATLASVGAQTFKDWELVVVDDGSADDTGAVVARARADARVRYLRVPHVERARARNAGLAAAAGDLIAFLDGDDLWEPEKLARQVAALDAAPEAALCYTLARYVDEADRPLPVRRPPVAIGGRVFPALVAANLMILASVMVRRSALDATGGFDETLPVLGCEDWDLWLRIARRHPVVCVDAELTRYRRHPGNTAGAQVLASGLHVLDRLYADPQAAAAAGLTRAAARARLLWYHAGAAAGADDPATARGLMRRALVEAPTSLASRPAAGALVRLIFRSSPSRD